MIGAKEIKARIKSIKNIQQITKAMQMVAVAKLQKFQLKATTSRPYEYKLNEIIKHIRQAVGDTEIEHPLLTSRKTVKNIHLILITSDKGLCGGFNSNIQKFTDEFILKNEDKNISLTAIGRKGYQYFKKRGVAVEHYYPEVFKEVTPEFVNTLADFAIKEYTATTYDEIYLAFTRFGTPVKSDPTMVRLLPVESVDETASLLPGKDQPTKASVSDFTLLEPNPEELLISVLPQYFKVQIYKAMIESITSEHGARMVAMKTATDNADDMLSTLILNFNRARQAAITTAILEVASGAEALK